MKIIIIGNGKVGYTLAEQLSLANHDLIVVDQHGTARSGQTAIWTLCAWRETALPSAR